jgi:hypothetical protein
MKHALEEVVGQSISTGRFDLVYAGALGAAALAQRVVAGTGVAA